MSKTSSEVKNRYNAKHYTNILIAVKKENAQEIKDFAKLKGISVTALLLNAVQEYMHKYRES